MSHRRIAISAVWNDESAVTAIEYGLLAALIVVASIVAISATGSGVAAMYAAWTSAVIAAL